MTNEQRQAIILNASNEGLEVSFINKKGIDLVVYREDGVYNPVAVIPVENVLKII